MLTRRQLLGATGLGLFLAQGLVTAMGGRIWVDSTEGRGASFIFELPAAARGIRVSGKEPDEAMR